MPTLSIVDDKLCQIPFVDNELFFVEAAVACGDLEHRIRLTVVKIVVVGRGLQQR